MLQVLNERHKKTRRKAPKRGMIFMLKKMKAIALTCALSFTMAINANAATVSLGTVIADALNVRTQPTTASQSIGLIPNGQEVVILGTEGNWYKIPYSNTTAYVSADYVTVTATNVERDISQPQVPQRFSYMADHYANTPIPSYKGSNVLGEALVELAKQYIGTPYVYGGMSPAGFDCSGFVKYCYGLMGVNLNRVAADQARNGYEVSVDQMLPGDILCFSSSSGGSYIGHTGIYVGNGYFIHSPRTGYTVEILPLAGTSYANRIVNVRRIF